MSFEQRVVQLEETNAELVKEVVRVRDAAAGLNRIYPSVTAGRQAVGDGEYFVVPGEGTYQTLYRRSGSSAEPIAEFPSREQLVDLIADFGTAANRDVTTSAVDQTDGRLMQVGDFGLGQLGLPVDSPDVGENPTRFFRADGAGSPFGETQWLVLNMSRDGSRGAQIASRNAGEIPRLAIRNAHLTTSNTFSDWCEVYHSGNLLGTVSQSGGTPTGAVIERGSNDDGEYVKFADGTIICTFRDDSADIDYNLDRGDGWVLATMGHKDFPQGFLGTPFYISGMHDRQSTAFFSFGSRPESSGWKSLRSMFKGSLGVYEDQRYSLFAIGRWY